MKQRWLVVIVGLPALLAVLLACPAWATMIVVCGIAGIAAYELLHTAGENVPANFYWGLVTTVVMQEIWLFKEEISGTYDLPISTVTIFRWILVMMAFLFILLPILYSLGYSFTKFNLMRPSTMNDYAGIANFKRAFEEIRDHGMLYHAIINTLKFVIGVVPLQIALALADAFGCGVNELPLSMVLSWYEQKAVCILLTLLALGVKNIYLGPTLPAFLSETVVKTLVETYDLHPTTNPQQDLDAILGRG